MNDISLEPSVDSGVVAQLQSALIASRLYELRRAEQFAPRFMTPQRRRRLLLVSRLVDRALHAIAKDRGIQRREVSMDLLRSYSPYLRRNVAAYSSDLERFASRNRIPLASTRRTETEDSARRAVARPQVDEGF